MLISNFDPMTLSLKELDEAIEIKSRNTISLAIIEIQDQIGLLREIRSKSPFSPTCNIRSRIDLLESIEDALRNGPADWNKIVHSNTWDPKSWKAIKERTKIACAIDVIDAAIKSCIYEIEAMGTDPKFSEIRNEIIDNLGIIRNILQPSDD